MHKNVYKTCFQCSTQLIRRNRCDIHKMMRHPPSTSLFPARSVTKPVTRCLSPKNPKTSSTSRIPNASAAQKRSSRYKKTKTKTCVVRSSLCYRPSQFHTVLTRTRGTKDPPGQTSESNLSPGSVGFFSESIRFFQFLETSNGSLPP